MRLLRRCEVELKRGARKTLVYDEVEEGILPPQADIDGPPVWVEDEVDVVLKARVAGKSKDEVRALVAELVRKRGMLA